MLVCDSDRQNPEKHETKAHPKHKQGNRDVVFFLIAGHNAH